MNQVPAVSQVCQEIKDLAEGRRVWIATAESCTGGLIGGALTDLSGSSHYYWGGVVAYHNQAKERLLGVPSQVLEEFGAVSSQTAKEMVTGLSDRTGVEVCLSVTGIAGPSGGTEEKPVGLVWFGIGNHRNCKTIEQNFKGDRVQIRSRAVAFGLSLLRDQLAAIAKESK